MFYQVFPSILALLALVCAVWLPIQTRRVRDGWKPNRFRGTHGELVAKCRGLVVVAWLALVAGVLLAAIELFAVVADEWRHWWWLLPGVAFLIVGGVGLWCRRMLDASPTSRAGTSEGEAV